MSKLTKDKLTETCTERREVSIADDFCKIFSKEVAKHRLEVNDGKKRRNRACTMSDSEIITVLICFHYGCFKDFKHFYLYYLKEHLREEFPNLLSYNRFIEVEKRIVVTFGLFLIIFFISSLAG